MKFKIPSEIKIAGTRYSVVKERLADHHQLGQTVYGRFLCKVDPDIGPDHQRETLIHEALHIIDDTFCLGLKESQVDRLSHGVDELVQQLEVDDAAQE